MELVDLMYKYINKFINGEELLKKLKKVKLSDFKKEEQEKIKKLIDDVKDVLGSTPNELDKVEKTRLETINKLIESFEEAKKNKNNSEKIKKIIDERYNELLEAKAEKRDGGKLYEKLFDLMTNNSVVNTYENNMSDEELLDFITEYITAPIPPKIDQSKFDNLVKIGIEKDKRESLWRLAFNYEGRGMDFSKIEDFFIEKRDDYYLLELLSAVPESIDILNTVKKVLITKDKKFIGKFSREAKDMGLIAK